MLPIPPASAFVSKKLVVPLQVIATSSAAIGMAFASSSASSLNQRRIKLDRF
jgi:hypothetical protein